MNDVLTASLLVLAAIVPGLLILAALNTASLRLRGGLQWRRGRPWAPVGLAFAVGVLAACPAYLLERALVKAPWALENLGAVLLFWLVVAGAAEEGCKFAAFHLGPARSRWYTEEYDGILFAAAVALGFASIENVLYVREAGFETARLRAFTAVPAHAMFGVVMGACLGMARARARLGWSDMGLPLSGLLLAVAAHGVYDVVASLPARIALVGVAVLLATLMVVTVRLALGARRRSPAFGGTRLRIPPPQGALRLPPVPLRRQPLLAGALGLVPGLGQAYNGEPAKAALFFFVGVVNLGLYWIAHLFVSDAAAAVELLRRLGLAVVVRPEELARAVEQKWMLEPALLVLVLIWEAVGALEAWSTARRRWSGPQTHAVRRSFVPHGLGTSYVVHILVVFMLVVAPVVDVAVGGPSSTEAAETEGQGADARQAEGVAGARGADGGQVEWKLTWVRAPQHIEGWQTTPEGPKEGATEPLGQAPQPLPQHEQGDFSLPVGTQSDRVQAGEAGSYNQYLSYQIRRNHADMHYFRHVPPTTWAVVHYRISRDGRLLGAQLVKHFGRLPDAQRAVEVVERAAPFEPLPSEARELDVIELFWNSSNDAFTPGSLEWELSRLPDGRRVKAIE